MSQFIKDYAIIIGPVAGALVAGLFTLLARKTRNSNKQSIGNITNSNVNQINSTIDKE